MALLTANCPRCGVASMTFDVLTANSFLASPGMRNHEAFAVCRHCKGSTTFLLAPNTPHAIKHYHTWNELKSIEVLNQHFDVVRFLGLRDVVSKQPPAHLPSDIEGVFREGAACMAIGCNNAAATMFRLCVDLATRSLLPADDGPEPKPNSRQRRDLGLRLPWLFDNGRLPEALRDLAHCIKEDGNDGAHAGTLTEHDVEDLIDFTNELLERLYTEPEKLRLAKERRDARRAS